MQSRVPLGPGKFHVVVLVCISIAAFRSKLNGQNEWALFNVRNSLLRKVLLLKLSVLFSKSVDVEDYSSITFFHIFEGFFVPLV